MLSSASRCFWSSRKVERLIDTYFHKNPGTGEYDFQTFLAESTLGKFKPQDIVDALKDFIKGEKAKAWFIYSGEEEDGSDTNYEDISEWDQIMCNRKKWSFPDHLKVEQVAD